METNEIVKGNTLIAKFLGVSEKVVIKYNKDPEIWSCNVKYHLSWEWLMPVVEKIESMGFDVLIKGISCNVCRILEDNDPIISWVCGNRLDKIGLVYKTVIEFIKWHNKNNT